MHPSRWNNQCMPITSSCLHFALYEETTPLRRGGASPWVAGWSQMCKITCYALISIVIARAKGCDGRGRPVGDFRLFVLRPKEIGFANRMEDSAPYGRQPVVRGVGERTTSKRPRRRRSFSYLFFGLSGLRTPGVIFQVNNEALS